MASADSTPPADFGQSELWARGPLRVTAAYFGLYYALLFSQSIYKTLLHRQGKGSKSQAGLEREKYFSSNPRALWADRAAGNMMEQTPPYLCGLWLHAWLVDAQVATLLGWAYLLLRAGHAAIFWTCGYRRPMIWFITVPMYSIIYYLLGKTVLLHAL